MRITATDADGVQQIIEAGEILVEVQGGTDIKTSYNHFTNTQSYIFKEDKRHGTVQSDS